MASEPISGTGRCGTAPRLGAVRRPGRVHERLGGPGRRGNARTAHAVLRPCADNDPALRRHGREVHRRRGDGGLGRADRAGGRRGAGRAGRTRAAGRGVHARSEPEGACGRLERRGRGHTRRGGPGHGRGGSRQHRLAHPERRPSPGSVLVGEPTKRASEAAVAYDDAGEHDAEGQGRAGSAVAGAPRRRGSARVAPLDWPRGAVRRSRPRAASSSRSSSTPPPTRGARNSCSINGIAGIGKSRLAWEFEKYIDGLARETYWHRGRCLSYGDGVAYWALAEMVRMRCGIAEDEEPATARDKLRLSLSEYLLGRGGARVGRAAPGAPTRARGGRGRRPGEPLLRLAASFSSDWRRSRRPCSSSRTCNGRMRACSISWRTCSIGPAATRSSCSRWRGPSSPTSARPGERASAASARSTSSRSRRTRWTTSSPASCRDCPTSCARASSSARKAYRSTRSRRCGCCSTAGCSTREGNVYRPTGSVETLEVPETLHALVAARLDALTAQERRLVEDGAVLGKTFTKQGLAALTGAPEAELEPTPRRPAAQGDPLGAGRPAFTRTGPVRASCRTSSSGSPTRRSRCATGRRSTSRRPSSCSPRAARRTSSSRWSRRTTSTHWSRLPTRTTRRRSASAPARCSCARRSGPARSPRTRRRSDPSSAPPTLTDDPRVAGRAATSAPG